MLKTQPKVLVAARQEMVRLAIRDGLKQMGIKDFQHRDSSAEVLPALRREKKWDLLIFDSSFSDALQTVRNIRSEMGPSLKILLLDDHVTRESVMAGVQAGINDFLTIPVSPATLENKVLKLLGIEPPALNNNAHSIFSRKA